MCDVATSKKMIPINLQNKKAVSKREAEDLAIPQMFWGGEE